MPDFLQSNKLTTLGSICFNEEAINEQIYLSAPIVIVIPCHVRHLEQKLVMELLIKLQPIHYITEFVIVVNGKSPAPSDAINALKCIDSRVTVLLEAAEKNTLLQTQLGLENEPLQGKGFALWLGFAYVCRRYQQQAIIATLDADIKNFTPAFLLKLIYPLLHFNAHFNKSYYVRYEDGKLNGRLTRLLVFPLLQAMQRQADPSDLYSFLSEFRYPLSGDVAITSRLISQLPLMQGWSYDLALLVEIHTKKTEHTHFQTEITDNYQHIHRDAESTGADGLLVVATEICDYLLHMHPFDRLTLTHDYLRCASQFIDKYEHLALFNSFTFSRVEEEKLVKQLSTHLMRNKTHYTSLPAWESVCHLQPLTAVIDSLVVT